MALRSMTAFAAAQRDIGGYRYTWELRSVNHRYLDLGLRLPDALRHLESEVRARLTGRIKRGRLDVILLVQPAGTPAPSLCVDTDSVQALMEAIRVIDDLSPAPLAAFSALDVLRWPGVLRTVEVDQERLTHEALSVLDEALERLVAVREGEGRQLKEMIQSRLKAIAEHVAFVQARVPQILAATRQKIKDRLAEVVAQLDSDRLEQEMVYLAQKLDVAEELDRLATHVGEMTRLLDSVEPVGRRLDFLTQELNREANTLAAKSADGSITHAAVEIKVLIEQIREQIQNIE